LSEEQTWREEYRQEHGYFPEHHALVSEFPGVAWTVEGEAGDFYIAGNGQRATKQKGKGPGHAWAAANANLARICVRSVTPSLVVARYRHRRFPEHPREVMVERWQLPLDPLKWKQKNPPLYVVAHTAEVKNGPMTAVHAGLYSHLHAASAYLRLHGAWCSDVWPPDQMSGPSLLDFYLDNP
jgi:hypothetical protein